MTTLYQRLGEADGIAHRVDDVVAAHQQPHRQNTIR